MKKYVVLNFKGGIGNQVFQLLAAYSFLNRNKIKQLYIYTGNLKSYSSPREFAIRTLLISSNFDIQILGSSWFLLFNKYFLIILSKFKLIIIDENNFNKKAFFFQILDGYFQDKSFIDDFSLSIVKNCLNVQLTSFLQQKLPDFKNQILSPKTIGLHIRLGDRYTESKMKQIKLILNNFDFSKYDKVFLFSDQPHSLEYVKNYISIDVIDVHLLLLTDFEEFMLCSFLSDFIVSNSTFSILSRILSSYNTITYYSESDFIEYGVFLPQLMENYIVIQKIAF
jgi:hypothetical protein